MPGMSASLRATRRIRRRPPLPCDSPRQTYIARTSRKPNNHGLFRASLLPRNCPGKHGGSSPFRSSGSSMGTSSVRARDASTPPGAGPWHDAPMLQRSPRTEARRHRQARWRDRQRRDVLMVSGEVPRVVVETLVDGRSLAGPNDRAQHTKPGSVKASQLSGRLDPFARLSIGIRPVRPLSTGNALALQSPCSSPPGFIEPCLPTLGHAVPSGPKWVHAKTPEALARRF
jgi:hypothetical protein